METTDFAPGDKVRYVPGHVFNDMSHPDCESGVVTSTNQVYVFVRFKGETSQACAPSSLVRYERLGGDYEFQC